MEIGDIIEQVEAMGGVLTLRPQAGDGSPEIAWGDVFFYYAPDGVVPKGQPFATIVTKNYPDDESSRLDRPGFFRLNIAASKRDFAEWAGQEVDPSAVDVLFPHPVYGSMAWLSVVNPGAGTAEAVRDLLAAAHDRARGLHERRRPTP
jgi:Family of unknown function (DUF6194)